MIVQGSVEAKLFAESLQATFESISNDAEHSATEVPDIAHIIALTQDLGCMLQAQCTKLSLAGKPPITEAAVLQSFDQIKDLFPVFVSLSTTLRPAQHGQFLCSEIRALMKLSLNGIRELVFSVYGVDYTSESRLVATGMLWESCQKLSHMPDLKALAREKLTTAIAMLEDAIEELRDWALGLDQTSIVQDDDDVYDLETPNSAASDKDKQVGNRYIGIFKGVVLLLHAIGRRRFGTAMTVSQIDSMLRGVDVIAIFTDELACQVQERCGVAGRRVTEAQLSDTIAQVIDSVRIDDNNLPWSIWVNRWAVKYKQRIEAKLEF